MREFDPEDCVWHAEGAENGGLGSVQRRDGRSRAEARQRFAEEQREPYIETVARARHIRPMTLDEQYAADREVRGPDETWPDPDGERAWPEQRPADWHPDEETPTWQMVHLSEPGAIRVWIVGFRDDTAPGKPTPHPVPGDNPMTDKPTPEFGLSPYNALRKEIKEIENALAGWTNNVQQHDPRDPHEAFDIWDEAVAAAWLIRLSAEELLARAEDGLSNAAARRDEEPEAT